MDAQYIEKLEPTHVAVLGTLVEFHQEPLPYDVAALVRLVTDINPDMLCLDISPQVWRQRDFKDLPPEYREGLLPLAYQTDIVVVPIGADESPMPINSFGWRGRLVEWLRGRLVNIHRGASGFDAINRGLRHDAANLLYHLILLLYGPPAFGQRRNHAENLIQRTLEVAQDNPGARILVVVNIQYCHVIRPRLRQPPRVSVVGYTDL